MLNSLHIHNWPEELDARFRTTRPTHAAPISAIYWHLTLVVWPGSDRCRPIQLNDPASSAVRLVDGDVHQIADGGCCGVAGCYC